MIPAPAAPPPVPAPSGQPAPAAASGGVQRSNQSAPRLQASLVPSITGVLLGPSGPRVTLVNISTSGALIEGRERLKPGDEVKLIFEGRFPASVVPSRVVRTSVAGIDPDGAMRFHVGLAFLSPIDLPAQTDADPARPAPDGHAPAAEGRQEIRNRW